MKNPKKIITEMNIWESKIFVAARCRLMWNKEQEKGNLIILKILDKNLVILMDSLDVTAGQKVLSKNITKEK